MYKVIKVKTSLRYMRSKKKKEGKSCTKLPLVYVDMLYIKTE